MLSGLLIANVWLEGYDFFNKYNGVLFFSVTLGFIMGLADDLLNTSPYFKFFVQFAVAFAFIAADFYIKFFDNDILNYLLTVFWVVGIMNSVNMLDNMDAITTSVSLVILAGIVFIAIITGQFDKALLPYVTIPALLSFLNFNWHPSKMYMGDNGSQFLGAMIAGTGILFVWNTGLEHGVARIDIVLAVALMFLLLLTDTTTVTVNRILKGVSPFKGDKNHTTHNLVRAGISERGVAILFIIISLVSSVFSIMIITGMLKLTNTYRALLGLGVIIVFLSLYINTKIKRHEN
jgi:UDP-GlcNAc:undecaprenyl-phosphate GlcNAc-1-phosphate transferase